MASRRPTDATRPRWRWWPLALLLALTATALLVLALGGGSAQPDREAAAPPIAATATAPTRPAAPAAPPPPASRVCNVDPADGEVAIAAAIRACPDDSRVIFPADRTYHQGDRIRVERRRDLLIDGNGSTFVKTSPHGGERGRPNWELLENTNVTLQNMTIRGALQPGPRGITPGNQFDHGVAVYGGSGVTVRDVTVRDVFGDFVTTVPSGFVRGGGALGGEVPRNVAIQRVDGQGAARMCIALTAGIGVRVEDSTLSDCRYAGIDLETDVPGEPLRDVKVLRNTISGYYLFAIGIAGPAGSQPRPGDIDAIEIRDNVAATPSDTCWAAVNAERGPISDLVVAANRLRTLNNGVRLEGVVSGSVTGNAVEITGNPNLCGPPRGVPVLVTNPSQVQVDANTSSGY